MEKALPKLESARTLLRFACLDDVPAIIRYYTENKAHLALFEPLRKRLKESNTSQNCSCCAKKVNKSLSTRTHVCPHCGFVEDRDVNAAINILKLALCTVGHTGTYAWGDLPSWAVGAILLSNGELMNQESPPSTS